VKSFIVFPNRFIILVKMFAFVVALLTLFRVIFFLVFHDLYTGLSLGLISQSLWLGLRFDLRLTVLVWLPFLLFSWIPYLNLSRQKTYTLLGWRIYWLLILAIVTFAYAIDLGYFAYLKTRLDASIVGMARDFRISMNMIWETYPVIPGILAFVALLCLINYLLRSRIFMVPLQRSSKWHLGYRILLYTLSFIIAVGIGYGKWSRYPLRWSDAYFTPNENANQLSINPVLLFVNTYSRRNETWNIDRVRQYHNDYADYFNFDQDNSLNFARHSEVINPIANKPNIVIFILETYPAFKSGSYGNTLNASPFFDEIAEQSIHFRNFYVPKFSTAASIFCAMSGLPDVSTVNKSSTRDPRAIYQHLPMNDLENYKKHFFIGGSANWGDIGGFFKNNVDGVTVHEEGDYEAKEVNAWGISDYHLLQDIHKTLAGEKQPFISVALTAGHHPPYSIPEDTNFEKLQLGSKAVGSGFLHDKEYNSYRFMDYALEAFFKQAENSSYYENTIFAILGDHGFGDKSVPTLQGSLSKQYYHVPLILFAPGLKLEPREVSKPMSEIDLMPTLLSMAGQPYINTSLGKNVFSIPDSVPHYAFTFTANSASYGLFSENYYAVKNSYAPVEVYALANSQKLVDWDEEMEYMAGLSGAYYELAKYLTYNNRHVAPLDGELVIEQEALEQ